MPAVLDKDKDIDKDGCLWVSDSAQFLHWLILLHDYIDRNFQFVQLTGYLLVANGHIIIILGLVEVGCNRMTQSMFLGELACVEVQATSASSTMKNDDH